MEEPDVCRICRAEATPEEPSFHPCKCSGSIQYVHQDCLLEWSNHTTSLRGLKAQCDLCKAPYRLRKRFMSSMPSHLSIFDYTLYSAVESKNRSVSVYHVFRALMMVYVSAVVVDFTSGSMITYAERSISLVEAVLAQIQRMFFNTPQQCGPSHATYFDYVLSWIWPKSCLRNSFVHGLLVIVSIIVCLIVLWIIAIWVLNEEAVRHDLEHIQRGEIAHMDHGDEDEYFDFLNGHHEGEPNEENALGAESEEDDQIEANANVRFVPPSEDRIPGSAADQQDMDSELGPINKEGEEAAVIRIRRPLRSGVREKLVHFSPKGVKLDPDHPYTDLIDPDAPESPPGLTREDMRKTVAQARETRAAMDRVGFKTPQWTSSSQETPRRDPQTDTIEAAFAPIVRQSQEAAESRPSLLNNSNEINDPDSSPQSRVDRATLEHLLRNFPEEPEPGELDDEPEDFYHREESNAVSSLEDALTQIQQKSREFEQASGNNSSRVNFPEQDSEEYLASLGSKDFMTFYDDASSSVPEPQHNHAHELQTGRAILEPPADLYADADEGVREILQSFQDNEDEEELGSFFRQVVGSFQRPNADTFMAFMNVCVLICVSLTVYASFYRATSIAFRSLCLGVAVLFEDRPLNILAMKYPQIIGVLNSGYKFVPRKVSDRSLIQLWMSTSTVMSVRYTVLVHMKWSSKWSAGRQIVVNLYEFYVVLKTLSMTMVECLAFPEFCGALLHIVIVPLAAPKSLTTTATSTSTSTSSSSFSGLISFAKSGAQWHNYHYQEHFGWTSFLQWVAGYAYMHASQIMVAACRKISRQGVLFFSHDTDAVYFLRAMSLVSLPKQMYRISISALLYGIIITLGIGTTTSLLRGLEPWAWPSNLTYMPGSRILRMWWTSSFLRAFFVSSPRTLLNGQKRSYKYVLVTLWLRERLWSRILEESSRMLGLQSWLFSIPHEPSDEVKAALAKGDKSLGYYVRAPYENQSKSSRLESFVPVDDQDRRLDGKRGVSDRESKTYTVVWRPRYFRLRLAGFAVFMWASISLVTSALTLIPSELGRLLDFSLWNSEVKNDIARFLGGLCISSPIYAQLMIWYPPRELAQSMRFKMVRRNSGAIRPPAQNSDSERWFLESTITTSAVRLLITAFCWPPAFLRDYVGKPFVSRLELEPFWSPISSNFSDQFSLVPAAIGYTLLQCVNTAISMAIQVRSASIDLPSYWSELFMYSAQSVLEINRYFGTGKCEYSILVAAAVVIYRGWSKSSWSRKSYQAARESSYLERIEVENYEAPAPSGPQPNESQQQEQVS